ncbi:MAG TPA: transketolase [Candidatus Saccharimonadales bacterium]|nr:transketolase [Candidatus Saccharimonadales bacterium]
MQGTDFTISGRAADLRDLRIIAADLRKDILETLGKSNSGHPGGSLSTVEILTSLYFYKMRHNPKDPKWAERDRFLLSKGHAAPALYCVLAKCGYFPKEELGTLRKLNSRLQGHPDPNKLPGVEIPGGPEGIGLSEGIGMALAARLDKRKHVVYVLMGDGEQDEGEVWEAAMAAVKFKLENLVAIIDKNGVQQEGKTMDIMPTDSLAEKWRAFNWEVIEVDGHDLQMVMNALDEATGKGKPVVVIAKTIKGKGVDFMEGNPEYHGKVPNKELLEKAIKQVEYKGN